MQPEQLPASQPLPTTTTAADSRTISHRLQGLFLGPNGLRALWRLLIFVAVVFALGFVARSLLHGHVRRGDFTAGTELLREGSVFLVVLAASVIMGILEKRSLGVYGLPLRGAFGPRFLEGLAWGFVAECATMFTLYFTGNVSFHGWDQRGTSALYYGVLWGAVFLLVGLFEELFFRGYPQFTLSSGIGFWPAAVVLSALFWLGHMGNPGETWLGGVSVALAGIAFCTTLWLTGNLWFAIGLHASWDWAETYFFGVPDSGMPSSGHLLNTTFSGNKWMTGGTAGPEGSVVELLVVTAVIALLFVRFRRRADRV